tara:strand:- start:1753 stop:2973 length:1221 start_codon:yes stop_codon:yes gene_type:complete
MVASRDDFIIAVRSAFLKKGNQQRFSLLSLIIFSIIFLILGNFNFKVINFNKTIIKEVVYLSSFIVTIPENIIKKTFNNAADHFNYYADYQKKKSELQELKSKDLSKKIIMYENIELKRLIDDFFIEDSRLYAKVLIDKKSPFLRSIIINKGSKNQVKAGMIVFNDIYLIGKVVEVNYLTSRVLLISDINSRVPVTIQPLNIQAIMSGLNEQQGKLQYVKNEKFKTNDNVELTVLTSGSGGVFKSGIPIGTIDSLDTLDNNKILVNFYENFSQLKYVRISSHIKENINLDKSNKKIFEANTNQIVKINNQAEDIKVLQQQKIIDEEIRNKFEKENTILKKELIKAQEDLKKEKINQVNLDDEELIFLKKNLLYGHRCRKTFFKSTLYKINTPEYRNCVLNKGVLKN